jgi:biotin---protein ligase
MRNITRASQKHTAFVYSGPGAGTRSVLSAVDGLRGALDPTLVSVETLGPGQLLEGSWRDSCRLLVMPGGADLPYCAQLNGPGNELLRSFVERGGAYLGLCAGAYYACGAVEFEVGSHLEVCGPRELAFFPGIARGGIFPNFHYANESGAVAASIRFRNRDVTASGSSQGSHTIDKGNAAWERCKDYVNGGPGFIGPVARRDQDSWLRDEDAAAIDGVEVLAEFIEHGGAAAALLCHVGNGRAVLCSSHPELDASWLALPAGGGRSDYVAPEKESTSGTAEAGSQMDVDLGLNFGVDNTEAKSYERHVMELREGLLAHQEARWKFWLSLLHAAGLGWAIRSKAMVQKYDDLLSAGAE